MLYVVATPIGNLGDISERALETLKSADIIAAEDTRHTLAMLTHFGIKKPLVSYYEENKTARGPELIEKLKNGAVIALVSDAGTPGISDPGADLIKMCIEENIDVTCVPGACACITAVVLSGFDTRRFVFEGFLPRDKKEAREVLSDISSEKRTVILYEAPHRLEKTLETLSGYIGERKIAVCRELTKKFEEAVRGRVSEVSEHFKNEGIRGEFVIVIEGRREAGIQDPAFEKTENKSVKEIFQEEINKGADRKTALKNTAAQLGMLKNEVYKMIEESKNDN